MQSSSTTDKIGNSPVTPVSSSGSICRICHEGDSREELTAPCTCSGSMRLVHRSCLEKWLSSSNSDTCEICHYKFIIYRQPKPFMEWLQNRGSPEECRNLFGDILCFLLLTPLACVSSYLCFTGAKHYVSWTTKWEASGLICLSVMLLSIYITWCYVTIRYHLHSYKEWRATNHNIYIIQMRQLSGSDNPSNRNAVNLNLDNSLLAVPTDLSLTPSSLQSPAGAFVEMVAFDLTARLDVVMLGLARFLYIFKFRDRQILGFWWLSYFDVFSDGVKFVRKKCRAMFSCGFQKDVGVGPTSGPA